MHEPLKTTPWQPSPAILRLLGEHQASRPGLGAERAIHYTDFYKKQAHRYPHAAMRKAQALADHLRRRSICIHPGEQIVGSHTEHRIGAICHVEYAGFAMLEDLARFGTRPVNPLYLAPSARRQLAWKVMPYWLTRNLTARAFPLLQGLRFLRDQLQVRQFVVNESGGVAHFIPDYPTLITLGTEGLRARIVARQAAPDVSASQQAQLAANLVALQAVEDFAERYRVLALGQGRTDLAELLARVPRQPAQTLQQALQLIWLFQIVIQIESLDQGISLGRIDQYLYPLYLWETQQPGFDPDQVRDLLCAFCLKLSEVIPLFSERMTALFSGLPSGQAATLGGIDGCGRDASNALSEVLLDVIDRFKTRQPNWHVRMGPQSPPPFLRRVFAVLGRGGGSPALYNDATIVPALARRFFGADQTWDYATVGCVEPAIAAQTYGSSDAAIFNLAAILENVLLARGRARWRALAQIASMEALLQAYAQELECQLGHLQICLDHIEAAHRQQHPVPFASLLVQGTIASATDLTAGGARFNASGIQGVGVADVANALAAIDKLVFRDRSHTLVELAAACRRNFRGQDALRTRLLACDKFGNDLAGVDALAAQVAALFDQAVSRRGNSRGGRWIPGLYSMTCHRAMGQRVAALPSGRLRGEALADGVSPVDGSDREGPTALLNSVAGLDHVRFGNGINLNLKFDAATVHGAQGALLLQGLTQGYFAQGGMQVQINVLDPAVLRDAMAQPHKHRNLLVRVSGYSAYFVDLTPAMQQEILDRTAIRA